MSLNITMKMKELELKSKKENKSLYGSDDDGDTCDKSDITNFFAKCDSVAEKVVASNKYILQISATLENSPNVALNLSDNTCEIYNLSNNEFAKLATFTDHTDVISEIKFSNDSSNLIYTGSYDGCIKLYDLRSPGKCSLEFKDTTVEDNKYKQISCFDISPNNSLLAAGTNLFEADSFVLFWDSRKSTLLGGYWESHTDDITQVKFHPENANRLISGSVDGLINLYDLSQSSEEDALEDSLNTESSIEKLTWLEQGGNSIIGCITHTADIQFWKVDDVQPYLHLGRPEIATNIKRKTEEYIYVVDVHQRLSDFLVLAGSNYNDGECLRSLSVVKNAVVPQLGFFDNHQIVRASWYNINTNLLLTGGEKGVINAWRVKSTTEAV